MGKTPEQLLRWTKTSKERNRLTKIYEPVQPYLLIEFSRHFGCSNFVDIGANVGFYSVLMASELKAVTIHAYEPMTPAFEQLKENLALNNMSTQATAFKLAISSKVGEAEMSVIGDLSGANAIRDTSIHKSNNSTRREQVPISTLDNELSLVQAKVSIKIDVEGHEAEVLSGGRRLLEQNECIIQFESYHKETHYARCTEILTSLGYRKLISVGPDQYFSNMNFNSQDVILCVSSALSQFVEDSKKPTTNSAHNGADKPIRRRLFRGVTLELSSNVSRWLRKKLGRTGQPNA